MASVNSEYWYAIPPLVVVVCDAIEIAIDVDTKTIAW